MRRQQIHCRAQFARTALARAGACAGMRQWPGHFSSFRPPGLAASPMGMAAHATSPSELVRTGSLPQYFKAVIAEAWASFAPKAQGRRIGMHPRTQLAKIWD